MKYLFTIGLMLICSVSFAADRYSQRKNVHGGIDIYKNGRYIGRTVPNSFGGYRYFLKGQEKTAARYHGYSIPSQTGGNSVQYFFNPTSK